jgi:pentatricopeptide repeat-containing protein PET309
MLERASTCLETGGRQLLKAPKRCLRSRRMLHSAFWHHGASDLALPAWWASSAFLDHASGDGDGGERGHTTPASRKHDGPLLDFLYPEKTLALIRRMSAYGSDAADLRRRPTHGSGVRQYSTSRWQPNEDEGLVDLHTINARKEMKALLLETTATEALRELLKANKPGKQALAWELYSDCTSRGHVLEPQTQAQLLEYLGGEDISRVASRVLQLFDALPTEHRPVSSYRAATSAYVALRMVGPAIQLLEEAATRFDSIEIGTDAVLKQTIRDDQWDLSFRVFRTFLKQADRLELHPDGWNHRRNRKKLEAVWGQVTQLPDLVEHLQSLLSHVRQFQHELNTTRQEKRMIALFLNGFVPLAMDQVLHDPEPNEDYIWDFFVNTFLDLRSLAVPTSELYEYAIRTMIDTPRYREYSNQRKIFLELYRQYREQYTAGSGQPPSRYLIGRLIVQHGEQDSMDRVEDMVKDLRDWHAEAPFTPGMLSYLVRCHAKHGLAAHVHEYIDEMVARFPGEVDLRILHSLVYVYARRIDVPGAVQQFKRLNTEFGKMPDVACWNTLLLAFTRADDLDGALACFNNCLETGLTPDIYTFGPMLDLCAGRGDVEAFEALYSRAKLLKVPVETDVRARSGYVEVFLNAGDAKGAEAILKDMLQSWRAGTLRGNSLTHTWNLVLSWYAVKGDLNNSKRIYRQMVDARIPLDSWTYASLMRALIQARQTDAAYKILRVTMPLNNIRVHAFHYAIVITGFLNEGQYPKAEKAHRRMQQRQLPQTESSRQASLLAVGMTELQQMRKERLNSPNLRLEQVEEQLRQSLLADYGSEIAHDQPRHNRYIDSQELSNIPEEYFSLVIMLYTTRGAYDICKQLFEAASRTKTKDSDYQAPIALLTAIMETHQKAKDHAEVERCWQLARTEADRLVKTFQQVKSHEPPTPEFDSITDPAIKERFESSRIATNRRQILFKASRIYIRSLLEQDDPKALQTAQRTIRNLLSNGFTVDNLTWNEFIRQLALRGRVVDAFSACEMYLMPQFPGWSELNPKYIRRWRPGFSWMELRVFDVKKTSVLPRYKTLVVLAAAWTRVKKDEANGLGFNPDLGGWAREVLEQIAPDTVRAIETMPKTGDRLQQVYLGA